MLLVHVLLFLGFLFFLLMLLLFFFRSLMLQILFFSIYSVLFLCFVASFLPFELMINYEALQFVTLVLLMNIIFYNRYEIYFF